MLGTTCCTRLCILLLGLPINLFFDALRCAFELRLRPGFFVLVDIEASPILKDAIPPLLAPMSLFFFFEKVGGMLGDATQ